MSELRTPALHTAEEWLHQAQEILSTGNFNLQQQSKFEACMKMVELARTGKGVDSLGKRREAVGDCAIRRNAELNRDPAARAPFTSPAAPSGRSSRCAL
jgi:hypothetical protein